MFYTEWNISDGGEYCECIASFSEKFTPILRLRIIRYTSKTMFDLVIRDYKTGIMITSNKCSSLPQSKIKLKKLAELAIINFTN